MKNSSLKQKLIFSFLVVGLLPMIIVGVVCNQISSKALQEEAIKKLEAIKENKKNAITSYFKMIENQSITLAHNEMVVNAAESFSKSFQEFSVENNYYKQDFVKAKEALREFYNNEFGKKFEKENGIRFSGDQYVSQLSDDQAALQATYIATNTNPLGSKDALNMAQDKSRYSLLHGQYHPILRDFLKKFNYYDIFIVDAETGIIVYSVFKEIDFATSLKNGPWSKTNLADVFKMAMSSSDTDKAILVDYKKYMPSFDAPASFVASPIWKNNRKIGVLILQMPLDGINQVMSERSGMGESGESYLVGADHLMRSDSFLDSKNRNIISSYKKPETGDVKTNSVISALNSKNASIITTNYLDDKVLSSYTPIDLLGLKWALVSEIHLDEALKSLYFLQKVLLSITVLCVLFTLLFSSLFSASLAKRVTELCHKLLSGAQEVSDTSLTMANSSTELSASATEQAAGLQETVASIDEISSMIERNAESAQGANDVAKRSGEVALQGKKSVSEMIDSISEISKSNDHIARSMNKSNQDILKIVQLISEIGNKTKVINDIVFQTKLLSFNASVEAARAGEHGKGFAVVAEEVGNLASMSGKAALEITEMLDRSTAQVNEIASSSKSEIESLVKTGKEKIDTGNKTALVCREQLENIIGNVNDLTEMIKQVAVASSEQSTGVKEVTKAMQQLDTTMHQNSSVAERSNMMSTSLKQQSVGLYNAVSELTKIISGTTSTHIHKTTTENNTNHFSSNVLKLPTQINSNEEEKKPAGEMLRASGMNDVPSANDSRFKDL